MRRPIKRGCCKTNNSPSIFLLTLTNYGKEVLQNPIEETENNNGDFDFPNFPIRPTKKQKRKENQVY